MGAILMKMAVFLKRKRDQDFFKIAPTYSLCHDRQFLSVKSTNERFSNKKWRGTEVRYRIWDLHAPGRPAGPAEVRA